jgi:hypothetical protein
MTLRIVEENAALETVIALHGWLSAAEVVELERTTAAARRPPRIELGQLAGIDAEGARALRRQRARGALLTGATPYIALLIERT